MIVPVASEEIWLTVVTGGVVSAGPATVKVHVAIELAPVMSKSCTETVWTPLARPAVANDAVIVVRPSGVNVGVNVNVCRLR